MKLVLACFILCLPFAQHVTQQEHGLTGACCVFQATGTPRATSFQAIDIGQVETSVWMGLNPAQPQHLRSMLVAHLEVSLVVANIQTSLDA